MDSKLNVESLRYVQVICDLGSFSSAAKALGISQPALSKTVRRLENVLDHKLFERSAVGTQPTQFASAILPHIEAIVSNAAAIEALASSSETENTLRIGVSPLINPKIISSCYEAVRELSVPSAPIEIIVLEANLEHLKEKLQRGQLDVMLVPSVQQTPGFAREIIGWEPLYVVDCDRLNRSPVDISELNEKPLLLVPDSCGLTRYTRDILQELNSSVEPYSGEAMSYAMLEEWAKMGLGQAILPQSKLSAASESANLLRDGDADIEIFYEAVWNAGAALNKVIARLVDMLHTEYAHDA